MLTHIVQPPRLGGKPLDFPRRQTDADLLRQLLAYGPQTWHDLHAASLSRERVLFAVGDLIAGGDFRVRVGPLLVEVEEGPDA
jgi:hypothetical protein